MLHLLKIEWLKIKWYSAFWWILSIITLSYLSFSFAALGTYQQLIENPQIGSKGAEFLLGKPFSFAEIWHTVSYMSSLLVTIPALMVIMLITNEYSYKTHKQNVIVGWTRSQFMFAKLLDVLALSFLVTLLYVIICFIIGLLQNSGPINFSGAKFSFIGYFFLQTFSQLSIAFLLGMLFRKSFIALGIYIFWSIIFEPILTKVLKFGSFDLGAYLPFEISDRIIPPPAFLNRVNPDTYKIAVGEPTKAVLITIIFTLILWYISFKINAKRDL